MEFRALGTLQITDRAGRLVVPNRRKQRLVLAALLLHANTIVPVESLLDTLWADAAPSSARANLQSYISDLRRLLRNGDPASPPRLQQARGGYLLRVEPDELDITVFEKLVAEGRQALARQHYAVAAQRLTRGLALWRGTVLQDLPLPQTLCPEADRLEQLRLATLEDSIQARIAVEEPSLLVAELTALTASLPLQEQLWAYLMLALYRCGRQADALQTYHRVYQLLDQELGVRPCPTLQRVHQQILTADPALNAPTRIDLTSNQSEQAEVPRQLPAPPRTFTGRTTELAVFSQITDGSAIVITAIDGMAGIGKTALAVHAAHQIADRYPDGQLFIDLHGYTQGLEPIEPGVALDQMLRALGVAGPQIPTGLQERAALYRTRLANRRMLIVLDNAATETQVQPLLPGSAKCLVVVTSRRRLAALEATNVLSLDTLTPADAISLFVGTVGRSEVTARLPEVREVVELCGRLPLAIRIAAARLKHRPMWTVRDLSERLVDLDERLAALHDGHRSVHMALHMSYRQLSTKTQRLYRLLGLHPGPNVEPYAAAALTATSPKAAKLMLDELVDCHLLAEPAAGRYRFHDLVRAHAADTAAREETRAQRRAALHGLLDHYRHTAAMAMDLAYPFERQHRPRVSSASTPAPNLADRNSADRWLDTELANLLAAAQHAAQHGWPEHVWHLSATVDRHLRIRGRYGDAATLHQHALDLAGQFGNRSAEITALNGLGHVHMLQGDSEQARERYERAWKIAQDAGDRAGQRYALSGLGSIHWILGHHDTAADHHERALQIAQDLGDRVGQRHALSGLGTIHQMRGCYEQAADHHERALQIAQDIGDSSGELQALRGLGHVQLLQGHLELADNHYRQALRIAQGVGDSSGELQALRGLGHVQLLQGGHKQAGDHYRRALQIAQDIGARDGEMQALHGLGHVHRMLGRHAQAAGWYRRLLDLAHELRSGNWQFEAQQGLGRLHHGTGHPELALAHHQQALQHAISLAQPADQARAHDGIAHAHHALNQQDQARQHWQHALDILTKLGTDRTEDTETTSPNIRAHLTSLQRKRTSTARDG